MRLRPFQRRFEAAAVDPRYDVAAMSGPRGLGKTFLAGRILTRCMTPGDAFHEPGADYILIAASIEQARLCYSFIEPVLAKQGGFRFLDSAQRIGILHKPTGTRLRVISSSGKTAMGIVNTRAVVLDEPGAFDLAKGEMMADALRRLVKDGPLSCAPEARGLLAASIGAAAVKNDDQGNVRLSKRDTANNTSRDDVAAALVLAAGALARSPERPRRAYIGRI